MNSENYTWTYPERGKHTRREGLGPLVAAGPRVVCRPPLGAEVVAGPRKRRRGRRVGGGGGIGGYCNYRDSGVEF